MNLLETLMQGVGAVIDTLSITTDTGKPLAKTTSDVKRVVHSLTPPPAARVPAPPAPGNQADASELSEADRIAAERLREMTETREAQERQLGDERGTSLKR